MRKRSSKPSEDPVIAAFNVVARLTGTPATPSQAKPRRKRKNPAAVALGRLGGLKGGIARKEKLTSEQRSDIASRAAKARWSKQKADKE